MFVCLSVCLLVCGGLMEIKTPAPILMKFCTHIPTKEGFGPGLTPACSPPGPRGLETLKAEGHIFKMLSRLQINPCSAGYLSLSRYNV